MLGSRAARNRWLAEQDNVAFGSIIREAASPLAIQQPVDAPYARVLDAGLVVLVRTITGKQGFAPYSVQANLSWPVAFADGPQDARLVLLVDRILLNVRGYHRHGRFQPSGEDFQVVLHCTLVARAEHRALLEFSVRGDAPSSHAGWPTVFGLVDRVGPEPWPEAGRRLSAFMRSN